jgi:hypothetical protein
MPKSMRKKWTKAAYGRERYLAKEFLKSKSEQMDEGPIKKIIQKIEPKDTLRNTPASMKKHSDELSRQDTKKAVRRDYQKKIDSYRKKKGLKPKDWSEEPYGEREKYRKAKSKADKQYKKGVKKGAWTGKETVPEQKLREQIREIIKEAIHHSQARFLYVPKKDIKKAIKIIKSMPFKLRGKVEVQKKPSDKVRGHYAIITTKQLFNAVVEYLATADIGVKTISKGKM